MCLEDVCALFYLNVGAQLLIIIYITHWWFILGSQLIAYCELISNVYSVASMTYLNKIIFDWVALEGKCSEEKSALCNKVMPLLAAAPPFTLCIYRLWVHVHHLII